MKNISPISNDETRSVMSLLPVDIIHYNILTKLPVKSLLRFKSVCKDWYDLINSSNFINIHLKHTLESNDSREFLVVYDRTTSTTIYDGNIQLTWFYMYLDALNYTSGKRMEMDTFKTFCHTVGSSNGLICLKFFGSGFLLCNPVTREYSRLIKCPRLSPVPFTTAVCAGFGYDVVSHEYKIVNIELRATKLRHDCIVNVYITGSNSWKEDKKNLDSVERLICYPGKSVVVNNKLHWIISKDNTPLRTICIFIFDLHTEEFGEISYPTRLQASGELVLELMVSRGHLCTLATHWSSGQCNVSMWVMKEYGVVESWTKLYELVGDFRIITHLSRSDREEVLLLRYDDDQNEELVWYNLENKSIIGKVKDPVTQEYTGNNGWVCIASLVPIPGNDLNKRPTDIAMMDDIKKEAALAYL